MDTKIIDSDAARAEYNIAIRNFVKELKRIDKKYNCFGMINGKSFTEKFGDVRLPKRQVHVGDICEKIMQADEAELLEKKEKLKGKTDAKDAGVIQLTSLDLTE